MAASPRLSTATAIADHSGERVVVSLTRSASSTATALTGRRPVLHGLVGEFHVGLLQRRLL